MSLPTKSCHNCRRRRLRCDRSLPQCHKCTNAGQECLGYQTLFIWAPGVASRGKMSGVTYENMKQQHLKQANIAHKAPSTARTPQNPGIAVLSTKTAPHYHLNSISPTLDHSNVLFRAKCNAPFKEDIQLCRHLSEPHFQDLNQDAKFYISHFNLHVCKDLVIYDIPGQNPLRDLIPLATQHAVLLNIIIAYSALHMSNLSQRSAVKSFSVERRPRPTTRTISKPLISSTGRLSSWYKDALIAKQRALRLLTSALNDVYSEGIDVALASVLLFIEFELADFAKKDWRLHINGSRAIINSVMESFKFQYSDMSSLRRCLISNCLVYDILGSTLARSRSSLSPRRSSVSVRSSLKYAETNNYLSFPAKLLQMVSAAVQLSHTVQGSFMTKSTTNSQENQLLSLLDAAQSFDVLDWASSLQKISPHPDLESRIHLASAHKAAVCIYITRVLLFLSPITEVNDSLESMVSEMVSHLSLITSNSELFKATSWPTFVAGADTKDLDQQAWAMGRLHELWECLPCTMGYARSAMEILECLWKKRDTATDGGTHTVNWIQELEGLEIDCMIA